MIAANLHLEIKEELKQMQKEIWGAGRKGKYGRETVCKGKSELQITD